MFIWKLTGPLANIFIFNRLLKHVNNKKNWLKKWWVPLRGGDLLQMLSLPRYVNYGPSFLTSQSGRKFGELRLILITLISVVVDWRYLNWGQTISYLGNDCTRVSSCLSTIQNVYVLGKPDVWSSCSSFTMFTPAGRRWDQIIQSATRGSLPGCQCDMPSLQGRTIVCILSALKKMAKIAPKTTLDTTHLPEVHIFSTYIQMLWILKCAWPCTVIFVSNFGIGVQLRAERIQTGNWGCHSSKRCVYVIFVHFILFYFSIQQYDFIT